MMQTLLADLEYRRGRFQQPIGLGLIVLALIASVLSLASFPTDGPDAWPPYLASCVLFAAGCLVLFPARSKQPGPERISPTIAILLLACVIIAAGMRYYRLDSIPFGTWRDEANISNGVEHLLDDSSYRPIFIPDNVHPTHFYALVAVAFTFLGISTTSIRVVTATFGVLAVIAAFLMGRELYGNRFGLICAFVTAVMRWEIVFSRFGILSITAPFFELLSLWLLFRARRTNRLVDYMLAGTAVGFGLNFYTAFRLFGLVLLVFFVFSFLPRLWPKSGEPAKPAVLVINWAAFAVAVALTIAPITQFALFTNPQMYWASASDASIFAHHDNPDIGAAILSNTVKHLLMFNYKGDNNGRHNLPDAPMLDPLFGVLFLLGLALAFTQPRSATHWVFLLVLAVSLAGGILSVDFEAPQANRTVTATVAVTYFVALAAETLWRKLDSGRAPAVQTGVAVTMLALGGVALYLNYDAYFVQEANNNDVWAAFNGVESLAAERMLALGGPDKATYYASVFLSNHETIRFLAPAIVTKPLIPPDGMPLREPGDKPVMIVVDGDNQWILDEAHIFYPNAEYHHEVTPSGAPAFDWVLVPPEQIRAIQGLTAQYWTGQEATGAPAFSRIDPQVNTTWPNNAPIAQPFVAQWSGVLYAPTFGQYQFDIQAPAQVALLLDNAQVLDGLGHQTINLELAIGAHTIKLQAASGAGPVQLNWRPPDSQDQKFDLGPITNQWFYQSPPTQASGLLGTYYPDDNWSGTPAFKRVDPYINTYFHIVPMSRPYTIDWTGRIQIPSDGDYAFGLWINGEAKVLIDNQVVVDAPQPSDYIEGHATLTTGWHALEIRYLDNQNASRIHLYWTPPGQPKQIVPSSALSPLTSNQP